MVSLIRYALFREADVDGSGEVTFDEFQIVVRKKLNLAPAEMSEARLRALWCALDADDSNAIRVDELAKLLKRYAPPQNSKPKFGGKGSVRGQAFDAFQAPLQARGTALASPSTAAMRAELEKYLELDPQGSHEAIRAVRIDGHSRPVTVDGLSVGDRTAVSVDTGLWTESGTTVNVTIFRD